MIGKLVGTNVPQKSDVEILNEKIEKLEKQSTEHLAAYYSVWLRLGTIEDKVNQLWQKFNEDKASEEKVPF